MGNSSNKSALRKTQSVPDTQYQKQHKAACYLYSSMEQNAEQLKKERLPPDAPVFTKEKSVSQLRLNHANEKPGKLSKSEKKSKQQNEELPQLPPAEAAFLPDFPLCGDLEELDFEVIDVIAKGAYGNVIKVQKEDQKRFYAVKVLDKVQIIQEGAIRQCKEEAAIQSMAGSHPFVVKAHEYWQSRLSLYIVLDYVPHGDMFTLWTFHAAFPEQLVKLYIAELAMVIDFLHNSGVIYRDLKMENVLFNAKGHIQLTDFGLAKWLKGGEQTRTVCGTLQYMAPEVLSVHPYGHPADWWSLGILMYAMLAGRYPVDGGDTHTKMAQKVFDCDFLLPGNISDSAQDVINRVLTKSPHKRLCDVNSLQDLDFFQDIFFSDLIEQKLNPVEVVPEDFFPMTGESWAPHLVSEDEQRNFDEFDDSNDAVSYEQGHQHYPHYDTCPQPPPAPYHHPDPVPRSKPTWHNGQQQDQELKWQRNEQKTRTWQPSSNKQRHYPPDDIHQLTQHGQDFKKPLLNLKDNSSSPDIGQISDSPSAVNNEPSVPAASNYNRIQPGNPRTVQKNASLSASKSWDNLLQKDTIDITDKQKNSDVSASDKILRGNSNLNRQSYGGLSSSQNMTGDFGSARRTNDDISTAGRTSDGTGVRTNSSSTPSFNADDSTASSSGSANRMSSGPGYLPVEVPPVVTLKTPSAMTTMQSGHNWPHHVSSSSQMSTHSDSSRMPVNFGVPGHTSQTYNMNKQSLRLNSGHQDTGYHYHGSGSSQAAGFSRPSISQSEAQEYKVIEAPPTISLPSAHITYNTSPAVPQNKSIHHTQAASNSFPSHSPSNPAEVSSAGTSYQKLEQAAVTLSSSSSMTPQVQPTAQRPSVPAKPVPAHRPAVPLKPSVPVRPTPAPRRSLRFSHPKNTNPPVPASRGNSSSDQNPDNVAFPYSPVDGKTHFSRNMNTASNPMAPGQQGSYASQAGAAPQQARPRSGTFASSGYPLPDTAAKGPSIDDHNMSAANNSLTSQQQGSYTSVTGVATQQARPRSGTFTSSGYPLPDTAAKTPNINGNNFQWNLPAGTTPSFI